MPLRPAHASGSQAVDRYCGVGRHIHSPVGDRGIHSNYGSRVDLVTLRLVCVVVLLCKIGGIIGVQRGGVRVVQEDPRNAIFGPVG